MDGEIEFLMGWDVESSNIVEGVEATEEINIVPEVHDEEVTEEAF